MSKQEGNWSEIDLSVATILEIYLPNETIVVRKSVPTIGQDPSATAQGYQTFVLEPCVESMTKLLAITVDHIDTLLEDWYPTLGK